MTRHCEAYKVATELDEHVGARKDGKEAMVDGGVRDDLSFEAVFSLGTLSSDCRITEGDRDAYQTS